MKTKISEEHEVERIIEVKEKGNGYEIIDNYKNIIFKKEPLEYMRYFDHVFQRTSELRNRINNLLGEIEMVEREILQNENLMDSLRKDYKHAKLKHIKKIKEYQRANKKEENGTG